MPGVKDSSLVPLPNRKVIIASFVTAYARLELFNVLHKLQDNVLYYHTDSVIFVEDKNKGRTIQIGQYLGEMTDELAEKNCSKKWIEQFCSIGPKSYAYPRADGAKRRARVLIPPGYLHPGKRKH